MNLQILWMLLVFGGLFFFMQRQQRKQLQKRQEQMARLAKGTEVVTIGGLYGLVDEIDQAGNKMVLDVDGVYLTFELSALKAVISEPSTEVRPIETAEEVLVEEKDDTPAT